MFSSGRFFYIMQNWFGERLFYCGSGIETLMEFRDMEFWEMGILKNLRTLKLENLRKF